MVHYLSARFYRILFLGLLYWPRKGLLYYYYPTIFWSPNNCRFNLNNPAKNTIFEFNIKANSHLFFVCPNHAIWTDMGNKSPHYGRMYENLMLVDEVGFKTCSVDRKRNRKLNREIFRCDQNPKVFTYTEEIFSSQRAFPNKMRYRSGKHYYFISTSDGTIESLNNTKGGRCETHQMKLKVYICGRNEPCEFKMPKCPYSDVFDAMDKPRTKPTPTDVATALQKNISTLHENLAGAEPTRKGPPTVPGYRSKTGRRNPKPDEEPSDGPETRQQSSVSFWGTDRTNIIIHITMALIVIVLILSLVYVLITRRRKTKKEPDMNGINSKLYMERPLSMEPIDVEILNE